MFERTAGFSANQKDSRPSPVDTDKMNNGNFSGNMSEKSAASGTAFPAFSPEKLREWIIAAEVLGKPKCKRRGRW